MKIADERYTKIGKKKSAYESENTIFSYQTKNLSRKLNPNRTKIFVVRFNVKYIGYILGYEEEKNNGLCSICQFFALPRVQGQNFIL